MPDFVTVSEQAARAGADVLLHWWDKFKPREKAPKDLVTEADVASQEAIRQLVLGHFPDHGFLGEEEGTDIPGDGHCRWIVDPLDGTANYVHRVPEFSVSVGLEEDGEIVAGTVFNPISDECFTAAAGQGASLNGEPMRVSPTVELRDSLVAASFSAGLRADSSEITNFVNVVSAAQSLRRTGSAAINLAYVAAGRYDAYWATSTKPWDIAAGVLLVREAGGIVTGIDGGPLDMDEAKFIAAATPKLHAALCELIDE